MMNALTPPSVQARSESRKGLPFGFGRRFFIALLLGLVWLVPAWWSPRLIGAMLLWDVFAVAVWLLDLLRLPKPSDFEVRRSWPGPLSLGRAATVAIELQNFSRLPIHAGLIDETPLSARDEPPAITIVNSGRQEYAILPRERGEARFGDMFLRYRSPLGFAERWALARLSQTVCILPDVIEAKKQSLYLIRTGQLEVRRRRRQPGMGREFESLREYRQGDDPRDICWSAAARRHQLITRTYQAERSQTVWIILDAGRLLRAQVEEAGQNFRLTKLDYAVNAALSLAQVASQLGDRAGLLAYGRSIQQSVGAGRGPRHIHRLVESLARVRGEVSEANHGRAARALLRAQTRRALVIWITDLAETAARPDVIEYALHLSQRHLLIFAVLRQADLANLAETIPQSEAEMFRHAAALEIVQRRELLMRGLRQSGVLAIELMPGALITSLINEYLRIKDRALL